MRLYAITILTLALMSVPVTYAVVRPLVEIEESVYAYEPANNGAGPLWCFGSTCLVRSGNELFASGLETLEEAKPLNNCRWMLFHRNEDGWEKTKSNERPGRARFHVTPENRLFVFFYVSGSDAGGRSVSENRLLEIHTDGTVSTAVHVPLKKPFTNFFTTTVRAGSPASDTLEVLGTQQGTGNTISYARVKVQ